MGFKAGGAMAALAYDLVLTCSREASARVVLLVFIYIFYADDRLDVVS